MTDISAEGLLKLIEVGAREPKPFDIPNGGKGVLVPAGYELRQLPPVNSAVTDHIVQHVTMHDADSFIAYVNEFKVGGQTRIFAEPGFLAAGETPQIVAKLDYHEPRSEVAGRVAHTARYQPRYSEQWERWTEACSKPLTQMDFADLVEEAAKDIVEPTAATLLDVVRTFKASKHVDFDSVLPTPDGSVKLHYSEQVEQRGNSAGVTLPEAMKLGIPVYFRDGLYEIKVFVRFRVTGGKALFQLKLDRADVIEDEAFKQLVERVEEATEIGAYLGRP